MIEMKIGCCINANEIDYAAQYEIDFIDLNGSELANMTEEEVRALAEKLKELHLPCVGIHSSVPGSIRLNGPDYDEEPLREHFRSLRKRLDLLGVQIAGIGSPGSRKLPEGYSREMADQQMIRTLTIAAEELPQQYVLLESLNTSETNYINSSAEAYDVVSRVSTQSVGLLLDFYHFARCNDDLSMLTPECAKKVGYLHVADPFERRYPSEQTDKAFGKVIQDAVKLVPCDMIAVEAVRGDGKPELPDALAYLKELFK